MKLIVFEPATASKIRRNSRFNHVYPNKGVKLFLTHHHDQSSKPLPRRTEDDTPVKSNGRRYCIQSGVFSQASSVLMGATGPYPEDTQSLNQRDSCSIILKVNMSTEPNHHINKLLAWDPEKNIPGQLNTPTERSK